MTKEEKDGRRPRPFKVLGRPRRYLVDRPNWTIRLDVNVGDKIKQMATTSGRSISEICERQIVDSFRLQQEVSQLQSALETAEKDARASEQHILRLTHKIRLQRQQLNSLVQ